MTDEAESGLAGKTDAGNGGRRGVDERSPLQARAAFLKNWRWESIIGYNRGACERGRAQHGYNSDTFDLVRKKWAKIQAQEITLAETIDFLRFCHRSAPFLFFNGNTFAEIARRLVDVLFADLSISRRREASSLAAHFVAGVLDKGIFHEGLNSIWESALLKPGDRVKTLRGSTHGIVVRIADDGRIIWKPSDSAIELIALPESLALL